MKTDDYHNVMHNWWHRIWTVWWLIRRIKQRNKISICECLISRWYTRWCIGIMVEWGEYPPIYMQLGIRIVDKQSLHYCNLSALLHSLLLYMKGLKGHIKNSKLESIYKLNIYIYIWFRNNYALSTLNSISLSIPLLVGSLVDNASVGLRFGPKLLDAELVRFGVRGVPIWLVEETELKMAWVCNAILGISLVLSCWEYLFQHLSHLWWHVPQIRR